MMVGIRGIHVLTSEEPACLHFLSFVRLIMCVIDVTTEFWIHASDGNFKNMVYPPRFIIVLNKV